VIRATPRPELDLINGSSGAGVKLALQALPIFREFSAAHKARKNGVAVVAITVFAGVPQPEDQQQAAPLCLKRPEEEAVAA
jgi:hypothetical protein